MANWKTLTVDGVPSANPVNEMNEYTAFDGDTIIHDDTGNLEDDHRFVYKWDAFGRLREIWTTPAEGGSWVATYTYDAYSATSLLDGAGRRVHRQVNPGELPASYTEAEIVYPYSGWQVVEEVNVAGELTREYTYASYVDEPVTFTAVDPAAGGTESTFTLRPRGELLHVCSVGRDGNGCRACHLQ